MCSSVSKEGEPSPRSSRERSWNERLHLETLGEQTKSRPCNGRKTGISSWRIGHFPQEKGGTRDWAYAENDPVTRSARVCLSSSPSLGNSSTIPKGGSSRAGFSDEPTGSLGSRSELAPGAFSGTPVESLEVSIGFNSCFAGCGRNDCKQHSIGTRIY